MSKDKKKRVLIVGFIAITLILIALSIVVLYKSFGLGFKCPFHYIFNIECPGCGGSRMLISMLEFDFYQAFRWNPFMFVTLPIITIIVIIEAMKYIKSGKISTSFNIIMAVYVIAIIIYGVARNISGLEILMPTQV